MSKIRTILSHLSYYSCPNTEQSGNGTEVTCPKSKLVRMSDVDCTLIRQKNMKYVIQIQLWWPRSLASCNLISRTGVWGLCMWFQNSFSDSKSEWLRQAQSRTCRLKLLSTGRPITGRFRLDFRRCSKSGRFNNRRHFENAEIRTSGFRTSTVHSYGYVILIRTWHGHWWRALREAM